MIPFILGLILGMSAMLFIRSGGWLKREADLEAKTYYLRIILEEIIHEDYASVMIAKAKKALDNIALEDE